MAAFRPRLVVCLVTIIAAAASGIAFAVTGTPDQIGQMGLGVESGSAGRAHDIAAERLRSGLVDRRYSASVGSGDWPVHPYACDIWRLALCGPDRSRRRKSSRVWRYQGRAADRDQSDRAFRSSHQHLESRES